MLKLLLSISVLRKVRLGIFKVPILLVPMKTHSSTWHIVDAHYMLAEWSSFSYGEQGVPGIHSPPEFSLGESCIEEH